MDITWRLLDADKRTFAAELDGFVPPKVYDVHAHMYRADFWADPPPQVLVGPRNITLEVYREQMGWILPGRELHALMFPYPFPSDSADDLSRANAWTAEQVHKDPLSRGQLLVRPTDDPDWVRQQVNHLGLRGLKPFCFYADVDNTWEAEIPDYLPEALVAVAGEEEWSITLHLMRSRGVADPSNQYWIRRYCENYPGMQLILDHCARGFNPHHVLEGLPALADLGNLWVDTSGVCNALSVQAVLGIVGPRRILYGSDFYVSHIRGTNFSVGDSFLWIDEDTPLAAPVYAGDFTLPLVGIENLRAVKAAFEQMRLSDTQIEDYFWGNAARLLSLS